MKTIVYHINHDCIDEFDDVFSKAADVIKQGGLVAFPTETVYGLGANALDPVAVKKIYSAKGRPSDNPLIVHIAEINDINPLVKEFHERARTLSEAFWPGPLTIILEKSELIPSETSGGLNTVAVRMPENKIARAFIKRCKLPIAAPSANSSGKPSPTKASHVIFDMDGKIEAIIDGGSARLGLESTIVDMTVNPPAILRPGSITISDIRSVIGDVSWGDGVFEPVHAAISPKSPGLKYTHYSPLASVTVFQGEYEKVACEINKICESKKNAGVLATDETKSLYKNADCIVISAGSRKNPETIGMNLFKVLRKFDYLGVSEILSESFVGSEIGDAIMNRLNKAAGYNIKIV